MHLQQYYIECVLQKPLDDIGATERMTICDKHSRQIYRFANRWFGIKHDSVEFVYTVSRWYLSSIREENERNVIESRFHIFLYVRSTKHFNWPLARLSHHSISLYIPGIVGYMHLDSFSRFHYWSPFLRWWTESRRASTTLDRLFLIHFYSTLPFAGFLAWAFSAHGPLLSLCFVS